MYSEYEYMLNYHLKVNGKLFYSTCIFNDGQDGPIYYVIRYNIVEEYEVKLKSLARNSVLAFNDEGD